MDRDRVIWVLGFGLKVCCIPRHECESGFRRESNLGYRLEVQDARSDWVLGFDLKVLAAACIADQNQTLNVE
jgi:hypothetical protein